MATNRLVEKLALWGYALLFFGFGFSSAIIFNYLIENSGKELSPDSELENSISEFRLVMGRTDKCIEVLDECIQLQWEHENTDAEDAGVEGSEEENSVIPNGGGK